MSCITKLLKIIKQTIMQNKLLKIIIYLIGFIVIFILVLMISSFAINCLVNTPNPFGLGFIDESNKDTWINFFGAIIGGITTLAGVWLTIKDNDKQRKKDLIIQYKPLLVCSSNKIKDMNGEMLYINIIFENLGRGEAVDVNLQYFQKNQKNEYALHPFNISEDILAPNCKFTFSGALLRNNNHEINNNVLKQKKVLPIENDKNFNFTASLSYKNPIDNNIQYFIEFDFEIFQAISEKDHIKIKTFNERPDDLEKEWYVKIANIRYSKKEK